jgi:hypothetical protein
MAREHQPISTMTTIIVTTTAIVGVADGWSVQARLAGVFEHQPRTREEHILDLQICRWCNST